MFEASFEIAAFDEALAWFQDRLQLTPEEFAKLDAEARAAATTIAGVMQAETIHFVFERVERYLEADEYDFADFKRDLSEKLQEAWGRDEAYTGWRLENIWRTESSKAFNAGRHAQLTDPDVLSSRPYWQFDAILDGNTSDVCRSADGMIAAADDPVWERLYPPLHFSCRSAVRSLTTRQAERKGITEAPPLTQPNPGFGGPPKPYEHDSDKYSPDLKEAFDVKQKRSTLNRLDTLRGASRATPDADAVYLKARKLKSKALPQRVPLHPFGTFEGNGKPFVSSEASIATANRHILEEGDFPVDYEHEFANMDFFEDRRQVELAGWITEIYVENDFVYGEIEWTAKGKADWEAGQTRYISPVILCDADSGNIRAYHSFAVVAKPGTKNQKRIGLSKLPRISNSQHKAADAQPSDTLGREEKMAKAILTVALLSALGLPEDTDETKAAKEIQGLVKLKADVLELTEAETVEAALGKLNAQQDAVSELALLKKEQADAQEQADKAEHAALVEQLKSDGKLSPAKAEKVEDWGLEQLKAYAEVAEPAVKLAETEQPAGEKAEVDFSKLNYTEKANLKEENPELYEQLKKESEAK